MIRLGPLLPLALAACATGADIPPRPAAGGQVAQEVRPAAKPDLRGRWTITEVNGSPQSGLWLELGAEGAATITRQGNAIYVGSPQPATRAYLGCNWWDPSGWTREGDSLILAREMSRMTERGCDETRAALEDAAYAILSQPMTMTFTPPDRLRLTNANGTIAMVREARAG